MKARYPSYGACLWKSNKALDYYVGTLIGQLLKAFLGKDIKPYTGVLDDGDCASIKFTAR